MTIDPLIPFDRYPVQQADLADLDLELVKETIQFGRETQRYSGDIEPLAYLEREHAISNQKPTIAAILAFTHEPDRWIPSSGIDIAIHRTDTPQPLHSRVRQLRGNIFEIIDQAVKILEEECTTGYFDGARIVQQLSIPLLVLRELTTNAAVHRDFQKQGSQVRIQIFPTYIEWSSPGSLPEGVTLTNILQQQRSRNPTLARFLFHRGYIETFGMGLDLVFDALKEHQLPPPELFADQDTFRVRVTHTTAKPYRPDSTIKIERIAAILALFNEKPTWKQREILERLEIPRATLQRDLDELLASGQIEAHGATRTRVYQRKK